uniref:Uncharacterized protein n=1 Tax=Arundo donax TaxID=35708 RepID=A0A0A9EBK5_ARUDO
MQSSKAESCRECECECQDRSSASEKHWLPSSSSEFSSASRRPPPKRPRSTPGSTAAVIADCSPSFTIATKQTTLADHPKAQRCPGTKRESAAQCGRSREEATQEKSKAGGF